MLRQMRDVVIDLVFPKRCALCGAEGTFLCPVCASGLPRLPSTVCSRCGLPLPSQEGGHRRIALGGPCSSCVERPLTVDGLRSVWPMEGSARQLVHQLKYGGLRALAPVLAGEMTALVRGWNVKMDVVVPVPLHPHRRRRRGYDQAVLLAQTLAVWLDVPMVGALRRTRPTPQQTRTADRKERWRNVADAFAVTTPAVVQGRSVLAVDDVATTGATLSAAANALKAAGARAVWAVTAAREL